MFSRELPDTKFNRHLIAQMIEMAKPYLGSTPECLSYTLFREFFETGIRTNYEEKFFDHRRRLNCLFFSYLATKDEKYLDPLFDAIFAISDEYSWAVPAHLKDRPIHTTVGRIDLFASETVYSLAVIDHILGDTLPTIIRERIRYEAERRILTPFYEKTDTYIKNNWSAIQSAGILATFVYLFPDKLEEAIPDIVPIMENFLDSYNEDGCCMEGALYWIYGFGFFVYGANMLREATEGKIDLFTSQKVKNMARYFENISFKNSYVVPFADTSLRCKVRMGISAFIHREFGIAYPAYESLTDIRDDFRFRFVDILHDLYWSVDFDSTRTITPGEHFYPDSQWYICRTEGLSFSAKGGHNHEPHNHNDIGNFALFDGEKTVLGDLGWEDYTRDYFGPLRYTNFILTPSSGHTVPIVDGKLQIEVYEKAKILEVGNGKFSLDIGHAYGVEHFLRHMSLVGDTFTLTDECALPFAERLVTGFLPELCDGVLTIETLRIEPSVPCDIEITSAPYHPRRIICSDDLKEVETAYFVTITPKEKTPSLTLTFTKV